MNLFFDTETTGFVRENEPLDNQPHLVQFAAILAEDDGTERASVSLIVKCTSPIPQPAAAVHGIDNDLSRRAGVNPLLALHCFMHLKAKSDRQIAHNFPFDKVIMEALAWRANKDVVDWGDRVCTMELSAPICAIPPTPAMIRAGRHHHKNPKLSEAYEFFFGEPLVGAHDALVDVRACARIYFHMKKEGMVA